MANSLCPRPMTELLNDLHAARGAGGRVAIVDSGVEGSHPWTGGRLVASYRVDRAAEGYEVVESDAEDMIGHGTAVAGNIRRFAPDADLVSLQVLGGGLRADSEALLAALRWHTSHSGRRSASGSIGCDGAAWRTPPRSPPYG